MTKNIKISPEGTRDLLFSQCELRKRVSEQVCGLFEMRGYSEVMTPTIEFYDLFARGSSVLPQQMLYKLTDGNGRLLALRPDCTTPIARMAATRLKNAPLPIRLYYNQQVFRVTRTHGGGYDQAVQAGIELIGMGGVRADLEIITTAVECLKRCGAADFRLEIGNSAYFNELCENLPADDEIRETLRGLIESKNHVAFNDLLSTLEDTPAVAAMRRLQELFGGAQVLEEAESLFCNDKISGSLQSLKQIYLALDELNLSGKININLGLVHRNEYYTGVVFRGYIAGAGVTVLSGGRYDKLLSEFDFPVPATGFAVEIDALCDALQDNVSSAKSKIPDVLVWGANGCEMKALMRVSELNAQGLVCENALCEDKNAAMQYAKDKGIARVEIIE